MLLEIWNQPFDSNEFLLQSMVNGAIGRPGHYAVSRVVVEHRIDPALAPVPHHNMEAMTVVEKINKSARAMISHAQVNILRFIPVFKVHVSGALPTASVEDLHILRAKFKPILTRNSR